MSRGRRKSRLDREVKLVRAHLKPELGVDLMLYVRRTTASPLSLSLLSRQSLLWLLTEASLITQAFFLLSFFYREYWSGKFLRG